MPNTKPTEVLKLLFPTFSCSLFVCAHSLSRSMPLLVTHFGISQQNVRPSTLTWKWTGVSDFRFTRIQVSSYIYSQPVCIRQVYRTTTQLSHALDLVICCNRTKLQIYTCTSETDWSIIMQQKRKRKTMGNKPTMFKVVNILKSIRNCRFTDTRQSVHHHA